MERKSKPIACLITDTHLCEDNIDLVKNVLINTIGIAKDCNLSEIFHLGDHFTNRSSQKLKTLLSFRSFNFLLKKKGIIMRTIAGNHDKTNQDVSASYIDIFRSDNFDIYNGNEPDKDNLQVGDVMFHFLPYFSESIYMYKLQEIVDNLSNKYRNVLLTHYGIDGVIDNNERKVNSVVKKSLFKYFDKVFIGHYHNASDVSKNIHYIGSTDPRNYGEDENKGVIILYDDLSFKRVKLPCKPYKKVVIDEINFTTLDNLIKEHSGDTAHVRIEFRGDRDQLIKIDKKKFLSAGIDIVTVDTTLIDLSDEVVDGDVTIGMEKKDIIKYFDEYCEQNNIEKKKSEEIVKLF